MSHRLTDDELWQRTRSGEGDAFAALFDRYANAIYAYCFRRTGDWALAEDLTSVTFLEAWRRRGDVTPLEGKVGSWLYGVATNVLRNQRRSRRRYRAALERVPPLVPERDFADEVIERLSRAQEMTDILAIVRLLPEPEQDALMLCHWQGLAIRDAAEALDVPEATVRTRLSRAHTRLREILAARGQADPTHPEGVVTP